MKRIVTILTACLMAVSLCIATFAHGGRTDSAGGHKDNKNASGLGYYHYHCGGNPPHLHTDGVCPYRTSAPSSTAGTQSSSGAASKPAASATEPSSSTASKPAATTLTQADKKVTSQAETALSNAKGVAKASATVSLSEEDKLSLAAMQEMARLAKEYGISLRIHHDVRVNEALALRLSITPGNATKAVALGGSLSSDHAKAIKKKLESWYQNRIAVISMNQQGAFGMAVTVIASLDLSEFDTENLCIYSYDSATNTLSALDKDCYSIDQNGFIHITTSLGGDIVITDGPWIK